MKLVKILGFCGVILLCLNSFADSPLKIGYVDINQVFEAYDEAKGISLRVKEEKEKGKVERDSREAEIRKLSKELQDKGASMTDKEKEEKKLEIEKEIEELAKFDRAQREKEYEPVRKALEQVYEAVEKMGKKENFDLIFEKRKGPFGKTVLFGKNPFDLTDKVVKELLK